MGSFPKAAATGPSRREAAELAQGRLFRNVALFGLNQPHSQPLCCSFRAKHVGSDLALNTTRYLGLEREYLPWDTALDNLDYFRLMFDRSEVYGPMQVRAPPNPSRSVPFASHRGHAGGGGLVSSFIPRA